MCPEQERSPWVAGKHRSASVSSWPMIIRRLRKVYAPYWSPSSTSLRPCAMAMPSLPPPPRSRRMSLSATLRCQAWTALRPQVRSCGGIPSPSRKRRLGPTGDDPSRKGRKVRAHSDRAWCCSQGLCPSRAQGCPSAKAAFPRPSALRLCRTGDPPRGLRPCTCYSWSRRRAEVQRSAAL